MNRTKAVIEKLMMAGIRAPVSKDRCATALCGGKRGCIVARQIKKYPGKVYAAKDQTDERVDQIGDQAAGYASTCRTDDDAQCLYGKNRLFNKP